MSGRRFASVGSLIAIAALFAAALVYRNGLGPTTRPAPTRAAGECARAAAALAPAFCIDLATLEASGTHAFVTDVPGLLDQLPACGRQSGLLPSFCVELPSERPSSSAAVPRPSAQTDDPCARPAVGEAAIFCLGALTVPTDPQAHEAAIVFLAARNGLNMRDAGVPGVHLEVESTVGPGDARRLAASATADLRAVESYFDRRFVTAPTVFVLGTRSSYARALERLLGYAPANAAALAIQTGGLYVNDPSVIFINWENVSSGMLFALRHELTHALVREIVGPQAALPAWIDEGLATVVQDTALPTTNGPDRGRYVALALLEQHRVTLDQLASLGEWPARNVALGGYAYAVAEQAVLDLERHISLPVLIRVLAAERTGPSFADAYATVTGEPYEGFLTSFASRVGACGPGVVVGTPGADRDVSYLIHGYAPKGQIHISIEGAAGYHIEFDAQVDEYGLYAGTFGPTAPAGRYDLLAVDGALVSRGVIDTLRDDGASNATLDSICGN